MKLDSCKPDVSLPQRPHDRDWSNSRDLNPIADEWQASTWVQLRERPTPYSYNEALLLCQHSDTEWVVWIPDCGEMVLHYTQFCKPC